MDGDHGLNHRFRGYSPGELADEIDKLRGGSGPEGFERAASALVEIATGLAETDARLRERLADVGVVWKGDTSDEAEVTMSDAATYGEDGVPVVTRSASGVGSSGGSFITARNAAPDSGTLRGPTEENGVDQFLGALGHTTDHARQVRETNEAAERARSTLEDYQLAGRSHLDDYESLPVPPGLDVQSRPVDVSTSVSSVSGPQVGPAGLLPGGGGTPGSGPGPNPLLGGGQPPSTGLPIGTPVKEVGIGSPTPSPTSAPGPTSAVPPSTVRPGLNPMALAQGGAMMGVGGAGGAVSGAERERLSRGGAARPPVRGGTPAASPPAEEARAARSAERFGARTGRPASGLMQPAATTARDEEDKEHVRKYGVDATDVFDDDRMTIAPVIGEDEDETS